MLWLTRDEGRDVCHLWSGDTPREVGVAGYIGDKCLCCFSEGIVMPDPNTCTRLYTETEMREQVAKAAQAAYANELVYCCAMDYLDTPTDANWRALARAVGMEDDHA